MLVGKWENSGSLTQKLELPRSQFIGYLRTVHRREIFVSYRDACDVSVRIFLCDGRVAACLCAHAVGACAGDSARSGACVGVCLRRIVAHKREYTCVHV